MGGFSGPYWGVNPHSEETNFTAAESSNRTFVPKDHLLNYEWFFNQFINQLILEFQLFILQTHLCSAVFTPVLLVLKSSQDTQTTTNIIAVTLCKIDLILFHLCSAKYNNSCLKVLYTAR